MGCTLGSSTALNLCRPQIGSSGSSRSPRLPWPSGTVCETAAEVVAVVEVVEVGWGVKKVEEVEEVEEVVVVVSVGGAAVCAVVTAMTRWRLHLMCLLGAVPQALLWRASSVGGKTYILWHEGIIL